MYLFSYYKDYNNIDKIFRLNQLFNREYELNAIIKIVSLPGT